MRTGKIVDKNVGNDVSIKVREYIQDLHLPRDVLELYYTGYQRLNCDDLITVDLISTMRGLLKT